MSKVKSQFPTGNFYLRKGNDGNGVIHIRYFINGKLDRIVCQKRCTKFLLIFGTSPPKIRSNAFKTVVMYQEFAFSWYITYLECVTD